MVSLLHAGSRNKVRLNRCKMANGHSQKDLKLVFKTNYRLMQVKGIAECSKGEHSALLSTSIRLQFVNKIFVLSIFEWQFYTGSTVHPYSLKLAVIYCYLD